MVLHVGLSKTRRNNGTVDGTAVTNGVGKTDCGTIEKNKAFGF